MYINCHSTYSLCYGTIPIKELVSQAAQWGIRVLALTDINCSTGVFEFVQQCNSCGISPIVGIEFRRNNTLLFVGLARNKDGFRELNVFLTDHNLNKTPLPAQAPEFKHVTVVYPTHNLPPEGTSLRDNEYIGIRPSELTKYQLTLQRGELKKAVVLQPVTYLNQTGRELHKRLRAIDNNVLLTMLNKEMGVADDEYLIEPDRIVRRFSAYPEIILNTQRLMESCQFTVDFDRIKNKRLFTTSIYDDRQLLRKLAIDGVIQRYGKGNREAHKRALHELEVIENLGFEAYFLITWDIIRYSMSRGFFHVGRGSGANSIVAYCLRITDVDPIGLDLYFERFLNPKRTSPPDFDIDYSWKDRDDVHEYIFKRYGREHTALLGAISTFQRKGAVRELGKVYGLPKNDIDEMAANKRFDFNRDTVTQEIAFYARMLNGFPNHRTIHAGGVLISEEPISYYTALDLPPKGLPTAQWDMYEAERIRMDKLDILSQRGLGHIKDATDLVQQNRGKKIDIHEVAPIMNDPNVKAQLKSGDSIGCFYIESPAMRGLLNKLHCDTYLTLVAASSIIRPGVASSGMMGEYIKRFHHPESVQYLHPVMEEQLKETYGVMVYQEDVIKVCHHFAGLDLADSDVLRRAMSGKYRSKIEFDKLVEKFFTNCREKGYSEELTKEVWRQIESFAGYSFSKAHSASYAVESFQSLYLKTYHPKEFYIAVINNFGGFYSTWVYVHEAIKAGVTMHLPCVNNSDWLTNLNGDDAYLGFIHVKGLEQGVAERIITERFYNGVYKDFEDFATRTKAPLEQLLLLIRVGALRFTGQGKRTLQWDAHLLTGHIDTAPDVRCLFETKAKKFELPVLEHSIVEDAYDEMELLGFSLSMSAFDLVEIPQKGLITAQELKANAGRTVSIAGNFVAPKPVRTVHGQEMAFAAFLDKNGAFFDTVHFPDSLKYYPIHGKGVYQIIGKVVLDFEYPCIEVRRLKKLPAVKDPRY
ncbi:MAG: DNA polymerase III subunit alpha [Bacteroidota bacterium]